MSIPKNQKIAIAFIVLVGAAVTGATLMTGRSQGKSGQPRSEQMETDKSQAETRLSASKTAPSEADAKRDDLPVKTGQKPNAQDKDEKSDDDRSGDMSEKAPGSQKILLGAEEIRAAGISVAVAGPGKVGTVLQLPGEIQFNQDRTAHVVPRVAGTVQRVLADLGQQVRQGQVLAVVASSTVSDQRSDLLTAQKRLNFAEATYAREKKLWEEKISAEQDYLQARQAVEESRLAVANAGQKLAAIGANSSGRALSQFEIRSPFNGTVVEKHIVPGDTVKDDAAVFAISDLQTVWADVVVSPSNLNTLHVGTKVVVRATGVDASAPGTVSYVSAFLGEQSRTAHARVTLANPSAIWRPGMFATVEVSNGEASVPITVKADAVQTIDNVPTVFLEIAGGFLGQPVKIGRSTSQNVEILQGLRSGDRYAATGSFVLKADLGKASVKSDD